MTTLGYSLENIRDLARNIVLATSQLIDQYPTVASVPISVSYGDQFTEYSLKRFKDSVVECGGKTYDNVVAYFRLAVPMEEEKTLLQLVVSSSSGVDLAKHNAKYAIGLYLLKRGRYFSDKDKDMVDEAVGKAYEFFGMIPFSGQLEDPGPSKEELSLRRGIEQAANGQIEELGSFAQYADGAE